MDPWMDKYMNIKDNEEGLISGWDGDWYDGKLNRNYKLELDNIPIEEIERYLRNKKLERIKKH